MLPPLSNYCWGGGGVAPSGPPLPTPMNHMLIDKVGRVGVG